MFVTLVRHMEVDWNTEKRFTAQALHLKLNLNGIAEAERMAQRLKNIRFRRIFCSDQLRALATATIIAERQVDMVLPVTDPRLREVNVGSLVGTRQSEVTRPEFRTRHPQFDYREIGGENRTEVIARQRAFLDEIKTTDDGGENLIVGHGTALRALLEDLGITEKLTRENFIRFEYQKATKRPALPVQENQSLQPKTMNIVTIGGGGGHAQVLKGLKTLPDVKITGICPSTDSGGSTGILAHDYGCLGYLGDLTKCIAALCPDEKLASALTQRFQGGCLHGHSPKNLLLLGLTQTKGVTLDEALKLMERMCGIAPHRVIPVSTEQTELCAKLKFGGKINGETQIDHLARNPLWCADLHAIKNVYLHPVVRASAQALSAVKNADCCVICPGDLYSSVIPVLLPQGIKRALQRTSARIVLILNLMTKRGETDGYLAEDLVLKIETQIGRLCDVILYNDAPIPKASLLRYGMERKIQLSSRKLKRDTRLVRMPLVKVMPEGYLYHDPNAIAKAFEKIFAVLR
jgi:uncharacterized cofD-like protein